MKDLVLIAALMGIGFFYYKDRNKEDECLCEACLGLGSEDQARVDFKKPDNLDSPEVFIEKKAQQYSGQFDMDISNDI